MKREVKRERAIPAFSVGVGEFEVLCDRLVNLFDDPENVSLSIDVSLPSESLQFDCIEEIKKYPLKGRVANFELWLSQADRGISIRPSSVMEGRPKVRVRAESEAWCASVIETVSVFAHSNKIWYHWFVSAPIGFVLMLFAIIPNLVLFFLPKGQSIDKLIFVGWLVITASLTILYFFRARLLPSCIIVVTREEGFLRRNGAELSLLVSIASAVIAIAGLFLGK